MTTNIAALERKAARIELLSRRRPKTHVFVLESGDQLTRDQRASIGPSDQVVIREYPRGLLGNI